MNDPVRGRRALPSCETSVDRHDLGDEVWIGRVFGTSGKTENFP